MKALLFAAGLGTRLKPITDTMPKAMVPICGEPLISHVVRKLKASGVDELVINVHHYASMIEDYVHSKEDFGIKVSFSDETDLLRETGGGILHAEPYLRDSSSDGEGKFLVHNVDILSNLDIAQFVRSSREDALSTIVVSDRKTSRYFLFNEERRLVGWRNISTGEVKTPYEGLDPDSCIHLAFSGIHYISDRIFYAFRQYGYEGKFPIVEFYLRACKDYPIYGYVPDDYRMIDVGKLDSIGAAESFVQEEQVSEQALNVQ